MKPALRHIRDMVDGETAWAVPWALAIDHNDSCWLEPIASISASRTSTSTMMILRDDGEYHVWPPDDYQWYRGRARRLTMIPVTGVHEDGDQ